MAKRALLSTSNKTGLVDFARQLVDAGYEVLSTGGTARTLSEAGVPVTKVSSFTGAPEVMNGRVKTLHPKIHGGILGDRVKHAEEAVANGIEWIDVVAVNLYPFEQAIAGGADLATAMENVDIGGPTMVRASAKNHKFVTIVVDPSDYGRVGEALSGEGTSEELRRELALKAFRHTARYDSVIGNWLGAYAGDTGFPDEMAIGFRKLQGLRYGENPHQSASFYADNDVSGRSLARAVQHQGKELSFNNLADLDGALRVVFEYDEPACAIIKHMNPAGCSTAENSVVAFERALAGDPISAYGGIVVFNRPVGVDEVKAIRSSRTFFEVLAAPGFSAEALERLQGRKKLRVLDLPEEWADCRPPGRDARRVQGGWLLQDWDCGAAMEWNVVSKRSPSAEEDKSLLFAWRACRNVKSNAIALARGESDGAFLNGVGAGQMSRVDSVNIAINKATAEVKGSVLASDAFFPFADGLIAAAEAGVTAVVQPGGSIRDEELIAVADQYGMAMVFTGTRHFRH
jgi:phosphoribosylaminoimidazolecarboxamide formyltransferase/IMP cyclohydrolase